MSLNRKAIRDWFKQALSPHTAELGEIYPLRFVDFEELEVQPDKFTNVYISDGVITPSSEGLGELTQMTLELGFNLLTGKDDDLDYCEYISDRALEDYAKIQPPPFMFYKERFNYAGESEDAYEQLYVTYQIITR